MPDLQHGHNPDVLSCLANLSNDEVFTPPEVVNAMLDMLPESIWSDSKATFLDPACKSGVFLREIAKRLITGLENEFPDLQARLNHIFHKQLFGIALTSLTALLSRRSLYCSKEANGDYTISRFENADGNIRFARTEHCWKNGRCTHCGASQAEYDRGTELESHAYEFIHIQNAENLFDMKFDVIIGNPPYQLSDGGYRVSASPIYHNFVQQAQKLLPKYLLMIIQARWFSGGKGLDDFRNAMLHDNRIRIIHDYTEATDCFPGVQIKGGVCYFLWDKNYHGNCTVTTHKGKIDYLSVERPLLEKGCDTFIRYNEAINIIRKIQKYNKKSFGFDTRYRGNTKGDILLYQNGGTAFISCLDIKKNKELVKKYKVYIPEAGSGSDSFPHSILGKPFYGGPMTACTETYLVIGPFFNKNECINVISSSLNYYNILNLLKNIKN